MKDSSADSFTQTLCGAWSQRMSRGVQAMHALPAKTDRKLVPDAAPSNWQLEPLPNILKKI